jgi:hypothetical protein
MSTATNYNQYAPAREKAAKDAELQRQKQFKSQAQKSKYGKKQETTYEGDPVIKFHKQLGFPPSYTAPSGVRQVLYSRHAEQEASADRYGAIPMLTKVNLSQMDLIELKVNARTKQVYRYLYRAELDDENDICLVLQPAGKGKMRVVTNWINKKSDKHTSLRVDEYVKPKEKVA